MRLPGGTRRLWRNKPRLVALGLLAATAVAASAMQSTATAVLQQTLDENWRGTYDILVTQQGKDPVTEGLLRSEALVDATIGRLSLTDLELIRSLPGVEVAAPIAEVSFAESSLLGDPQLWLPVPVRPDASLENPQAFRISLSSEMDDGTGLRQLGGVTVLAFAYQPSFSQIVFDSNGAPLIGPDGETVYATQALADSPRLLSADASVQFSGGAFDPATGTIPLGLILSPRPATNIALVDPVAERALLGDAGSFLDPLIEYESGSGDYPIVTLEKSPAQVTVSVTVEEYTEVTPGVGGAEAVEQAQGTGFLQNGQIAPAIVDDARTTVLGSYMVDVSDDIVPFADELVLVGGIEQDLVEETIGSTLADVPPGPRSVLNGRYIVPPDARSGETVTIAPRGYASYGFYAEAPMSGGSAPPGAVTEYTKLFGSVGRSSANGLENKGFDVVGSYRPEEIRELAGDTSFMPLGVYDVSSPELVADPAGRPLPPQHLATSLTGFGLPGTNNMAIGSFDILENWDVDRPISSIRIRVSGIETYNEQARERLLNAVVALNSLGFTATVVAGSSPQDLPVLVSQFALTEKSSVGGQVIADLGFVEQQWSRLGAVVEAESGVSATSIALLVVSTVAVGILLAVVQLGSIPARRTESVVLRELGWRRRRIARWWAAEEVPAVLGIAVVGAVSVLFSTRPDVASLAVATAVGLVVITSLVAVVAGARAPRATARRLRPHAASRPPSINGPIAFGARQSRAHLVHSVTLGLAVLLITLAIATGVTVFIQGRDIAGPSLLGAVASARGWVPQGVLAAVTLAAGITLAVLSRRMSAERRKEQWAAIRAMGWAGRDVIRGHLSELAFSAVPGLIVGVLLAGAITAVQAPESLLPVLVASTLGGAITVFVVLFTSRRLN